MDLGRPINEGLDLGQVTGGFVQGMGWVTTEKLFYNGNGVPVTFLWEEAEWLEILLSH